MIQKWNRVALWEHARGKVSVLLVTLLVLVATTVRADSIVFSESETLHVFCASSTPTCLSNGTITPTGTNPPAFGFRRSPPDTLADSSILLEFLIPNTSGALSFSVTGTNTGTTLAVDAALFSSTAWTNGFLHGYLGLIRDGGPENPLDAFLPSTQVYSPGATGYFVYQTNHGSVTAFSNVIPGTNPTFVTDIAGFPFGTIILATLRNNSNGHIIDSTANSSALLITPEPTSLLLLGSGLLAIGRLARKRKL